MSEYHFFGRGVVRHVYCNISLLIPRFDVVLMWWMRLGWMVGWMEKDERVYGHGLSKVLLSGCCLLPMGNDEFKIDLAVLRDGF